MEGNQTPKNIVDMKRKRILVLADPYVAPTFRYVKKMCDENFEIILVNVPNSEDKMNYQKYYTNNEVKVISIDVENPYLRTLMFVKKIMEMDIFDICHVHFVCQYKCLIVKLCENRFKELVVNFWGSDFYKPTGALRKLQNKVLEITDTVMVPTEKMEKDLINVWPELSDHIHTARFKIELLQLLITGNLKDSEYKKYIDEITKNYMVVMVGYSGHVAHKHDKCIQAISQCDENVRKNIFVVFMMSYGLTKEYEMHIDNMLKEVDFKYVVIKDFLTEEKVAHWRNRADIFMHLRDTDAFSAAMQESMYCGTIIMQGSWLRYPELEKRNSFIVEVEKFEELSEKFEYVASNINELKHKSAVNKGCLLEVLSENGYYENWTQYYNDIRIQHPRYGCESVIEFFDEYVIQLHREKMYREIMQRWLEENINKREPCRMYIEEKKYTKVIIYGVGTLGKLVYEEIRNMDIDIILCDANTESVYWTDKEILKPYELDDVVADVIIITPIHIFDKIVETINLNKDCCVLSLCELLNM